MDQRRGFALLPPADMGIKKGDVFLVKINTKPFPTQLRVMLTGVAYEPSFVEYSIYIADKRVGEFSLTPEEGTMVNFGNPHIEIRDYVEEILEGLELELARWPHHDKAPTGCDESKSLTKIRPWDNAIRHISGLFDRVQEKLNLQKFHEGHKRGDYPKRPGKGRGKKPHSSK